MFHMRKFYIGKIYMSKVCTCKSSFHAKYKRQTTPKGEFECTEPTEFLEYFGSKDGHNSGMHLVQNGYRSNQAVTFLLLPNNQWLQLIV